MKFKYIIPLLFASIIFISGCTTVNNLDQYSYKGETLEKNMRLPPEPEVQVDFSINHDSKDMVGSIFSIGTSIVKANEARKAEKRMRKALKYVDVPQIIEKEVYGGFISVLDLYPTDDDADYLLDMEIEEYGLYASSGGTVRFEIETMIRLFHNRTRQIVWRRKIAHDEPVSPYFFGFSDTIDNVITAGLLSELSEEQIRDGFEKLAQEVSRKAARKLERDLYKAKY